MSKERKTRFENAAVDRKVKRHATRSGANNHQYYSNELSADVDMRRVSSLQDAVPKLARVGDEFDEWIKMYWSCRRNYLIAVIFAYRRLITLYGGRARNGTEDQHLMRQLLVDSNPELFYRSQGWARYLLHVHRSNKKPTDVANALSLLPWGLCAPRLTGGRRVGPTSKAAPSKRKRRMATFART